MDNSDKNGQRNTNFQEIIKLGVKPSSSIIEGDSDNSNNTVKIPIGSAAARFGKNSLPEKTVVLKLKNNPVDFRTPTTVPSGFNSDSSKNKADAKTVVLKPKVTSGYNPVKDISSIPEITSTIAISLPTNAVDTDKTIILKREENSDYPKPNQNKIDPVSPVNSKSANKDLSQFSSKEGDVELTKTFKLRALASKKPVKTISDKDNGLALTKTFKLKSLKSDNKKSPIPYLNKLGAENISSGSKPEETPKHTLSLRIKNGLQKVKGASGVPAKTKRESQKILLHPVKSSKSSLDPSVTQTLKLKRKDPALNRSKDGNMKMISKTENTKSEIDIPPLQLDSPSNKAPDSTVKLTLGGLSFEDDKTKAPITIPITEDKSISKKISLQTAKSKAVKVPGLIPDKPKAIRLTSKISQSELREATLKTEGAESVKTVAPTPAISKPIKLSSTIDDKPKPIKIPPIVPKAIDGKSKSIKIPPIVPQIKNFKKAESEKNEPISISKQQLINRKMDKTVKLDMSAPQKAAIRNNTPIPEMEVVDEVKPRQKRSNKGANKYSKSIIPKKEFDFSLSSIIISVLTLLALIGSVFISYLSFGFI